MSDSIVWLRPSGTTLETKNTPNLKAHLESLGYKEKKEAPKPTVKKAVKKKAPKSE